MTKIEAIVVSSGGFIVDKILCEFDDSGNPIGYILNTGDFVVIDDIGKALDMIAPVYTNGEWIETASQQELDDRNNQREAERKIAEQQNNIKIATQRLAFIQAETLSDDKAAIVKGLYLLWDCGASYKTGDRVQYNGALYKCLQSHVSQPEWSPDAASSLWVAISDPADEWPVWVQPAGAHDAYARGDKVTHNSIKFTSNVDANVWEPGTYGWDVSEA